METYKSSFRFFQGLLSAGSAQFCIFYEILKKRCNEGEGQVHITIVAAGLRDEYQGSRLSGEQGIRELVD